MPENVPDRETTSRSSQESASWVLGTLTLVFLGVAYYFPPSNPDAKWILLIITSISTGLLGYFMTGTIAGNANFSWPVKITVQGAGAIFLFIVVLLVGSQFLGKPPILSEPERPASKTEPERPASKTEPERPASIAKLEAETYKGRAMGTVDLGGGPMPKQGVTFELEVQSVDQQRNVSAVLSIPDALAPFLCGVQKIKLQGRVNSQGDLNLSGSMEALDPLDGGSSNNTITCRLSADVKGKEITGRYNIVRTRTVPDTPMVSHIVSDVTFKANP